MSLAGAEIKIIGHVQGVGYRYFCFNKARVLGLNGWVKNMPDYSVSAYVEGEKEKIESFIELLRIGPGTASVGNVDINWVPYKGNYHSFQITG